MKYPFAPWLAPSLALLVGCSVYDSSLLTGSTGSGGNSAGGFGGQASGGLGGQGTTSTGGQGGGGGLGPGGSGGSGASTSSSSGPASGGGGSGGCNMPGDCPGMDTTCSTRTCTAHACGTDLAPMGTTCTESGGQFCDDAGHCVECLMDVDCMSHVCKPDHSCAMATCNDSVQNGTETDVDCGGSCVRKCPFAEHCMMGSDCIGGSCVATLCAATCTDTAKNGTETDVDCGGTCPACGVGKDCVLPGDCTTNLCNGGKCAFQLLISEIKTRGAAGGSDEFVEIYNPMAVDLALDANWTIEVRSSTSSSYSVKAFGSGTTLPSHKHFLIGGSAYAGPPAADATGLPGIKDAASVVLKHGGTVVDAVCFSYNQTTHDAIANGTGYTCEGALVSNLPHNDGSTGASNSDVSIERKPGGAAGNATDTGDSASDFTSDVPSTPQNLASAATP